MKRRTFLALAAACAAPARAALTDPSSPITLYVPWPAGGATDLVLRALAATAGTALGQPIAVVNRPGAAGTLAMPLLQQAAPDGHVIAQLPQTVLRAPWLHPLAWDPIRDTTPILQVAGTTFGIVVPASSPCLDLEALLAFAQANPDALTVASNGVGTTPHIVIDELMRRRQARWVHVPYKGTAEQMVAVASGQVMAAVGATGFAPYVDDGKLRLLATFGGRRSARWPQVPTLKELGHGIVAISPWGIAGPAGMSAGIVERLHQAFRAGLTEPGVRAELAKYDQEQAYLGPAAYAAALRAAYSAEQGLVAQLGLGKH